jgi:HK97 gp10 family phage protein
VSVRFARKERFFRALKATVPKIVEALTDVNQAAADDMVSLAKRLVPVADVDGGELRDSIRSHGGERETSIVFRAGGVPETVKDGQDYARYVEFGTSDTPAQPFFWPAFRVVRRGHKNKVSRAINKAIREAGFGK